LKQTRISFTKIKTNELVNTCTQISTTKEEKIQEISYENLENSSKTFTRKRKYSKLTEDREKSQESGKIDSADVSNQKKNLLKHENKDQSRPQPKEEKNLSRVNQEINDDTEEKKNCESNNNIGQKEASKKAPEEEKKDQSARKAKPRN